ncbi:P-loop containing nucleoside triphosphate hydrolase protein [Cunninghamella echinulata]|nr:P-loop containing nucleoside triphosphate hydrolase protein [Cunninghamella echinulata]
MPAAISMKHSEDHKSKSRKEGKSKKRERSNNDQAEKLPKKIKFDEEGQQEENGYKENNNDAVEDQSQQEEEEEEEEIPDHLKLSNFRISQGTIENLASHGIKSLFEIQSKTFNAIFDGADMLARARTGTGKTLAFALPVIEKLALDTTFNARRGRAPRVLVLCPTRDLAKQVCGDFEYISGSRLVALPVYGGVPYSEQTSVFRQGCDVVVGTPGRVMDHIKFGNLKLHDLRYIVLDEADEM